MSSLPDEGFVRIGQILEVLPISRSTWLNGVKSGKYPPAIKLSARVTAWDVGAIRELIAELGGKQEQVD